MGPGCDEGVVAATKPPGRGVEHACKSHRMAPDIPAAQLDAGSARMRDHAGSQLTRENPLMRTSSFIAVALMLAGAVLAFVAGCTQQAPTAEIAATPSTPAASAAATTTAATSTVPDAQVDVSTPASAGVTAEVAAPDDHAAVNAAIDSALGNHAKYESLIASFQAAVATKNAAAVAALVAYPFTARIDGKAVKIADAAAFVARYDAIVTPGIAEVIARQKYADLFVNYKGVMFGNGEAWINGICNDTACADAEARVVAIQPVQ